MIRVITARKRSLGQGNIFTPVCHSVHGGEYLGRYPPPRDQVHPQDRVDPPYQVPPQTRYTPLGPGTPTPSGPGTPWDQVHPLGQGTPSRLGTPPGPGTPPRDQKCPPWTRYTTLTRYTTPPGPGTSHTWYTPGDQVHPRGPGTPLGIRYTHSSSACWEIPETSGRYASYWNAFLFSNNSPGLEAIPRAP